ncbi:DUF3291 domain-containing protein [Plantactinospora sp. CA-294935]|uniref:DUF3291 domain-containing protein n=1 Tax=Plantactinospora sp. CA-294935 TaxID=3240012 RepID=UPI003D8AAD72
MAFHLAQLNIARLRAPLDDPLMADFVADLPTLNGLADTSPGFVWRLRDEEGGGDDATALRPFGPDVLVNLTVWESVPALRDYVYRSPHLESLRRRREWFHPSGADPHLVLWWLPAGELPTLADAWVRLDRLARTGPTPAAFTLRHTFPPPEPGSRSEPGSRPEPVFPEPATPPGPALRTGG